jgi:hypothetical protein
MRANYWPYRYTNTACTVTACGIGSRNRRYAKWRPTVLGSHSNGLCPGRHRPVLSHQSRWCGIGGHPPKVRDPPPRRLIPPRRRSACSGRGTGATVGGSPEMSPGAVSVCRSRKVIGQRACSNVSEKSEALPCHHRPLRQTGALVVDTALTSGGSIRRAAMAWLTSRLRVVLHYTQIPPKCQRPFEWKAGSWPKPVPG